MPFISIMCHFDPNLSILVERLINISFKSTRWYRLVLAPLCNLYRVPSNSLCGNIRQTDAETRSQKILRPRWRLGYNHYHKFGYDISRVSYAYVMNFKMASDVFSWQGFAWRVSWGAKRILCTEKNMNKPQNLEIFTPWYLN